MVAFRVLNRDTSYPYSWAFFLSVLRLLQTSCLNDYAPTLCWWGIPLCQLQVKIDQTASNYIKITVIDKFLSMSVLRRNAVLDSNL